MSDVGDYAYSDYDDFEDFLYDADPAPELADELADHTLHSPVYRDEDAVQTELQDYFSDWEYYSDDYMDDDPVLLRKNPQIGTPPRRPVRVKQAAKQGTKRKRVEVAEDGPPETEEDVRLVKSIRGIVWAKATSDQDLPIYTDGQEKKVALLKNWKEVFNFKSNGWSRSAQRFDEDESWRDMSLEDMGLRNVQRQASFDPNTQQAEDLDTDLEDDEHEEEEVDGDGEVQGDENGSDEASDGVVEDGAGERSDEDGIRRKRRRLKPDLPSPPLSNEVLADLVEKKEGAYAISGQPEPEVEARNEPARTQENAVNAQTGSAGDGRSNRKRKATGEHDEVKESGMQSRAKRVASTRMNTTQQNMPAPPRPQRSNKAK